MNVENSQRHWAVPGVIICSSEGSSRVCANTRQLLGDISLGILDFLVGSEGEIHIDVIKQGKRSEKTQEVWIKFKAGKQNSAFKELDMRHLCRSEGVGFLFRRTWKRTWKSPPILNTMGSVWAALWELWEGPHLPVNSCPSLLPNR